MGSEELKNLDLNILMDILAERTAEYMRLLKAGELNEEYQQCKTLIQLITKEIQERKES